MFDTRLFLVLVAVAAGALMLGVPLQVRAVMSLRKERGLQIPNRPGAIAIGAFVQQSILVAGMVALGVWLSPGVGLHAPVFSAIAGSTSFVASVQSQIVPALVAGVAVTIPFLLLYYGVFRPKLGDDTVQLTEALRVRMGLSGRVLVGGIVEEVLFRWGVMTLLAWLAIPLAGIPLEAGMWLAIVGAGILFGLAHLPGAVAVGVNLTRAVVVTAITLNLTVAVVFGWLFWQHGLFAAMVAHGLLHVIWWPFESRHVTPRFSGTSPEAPDSQ